MSLPRTTQQLVSLLILRNAELAQLFRDATLGLGSSCQEVYVSKAGRPFEFGTGDGNRTASQISKPQPEERRLWRDGIYDQIPSSHGNYSHCSSVD